LGRVAGVVAVDAASDGDRAVAVGASEVQPQTDLINPRGESFFERAVKSIEALPAPSLLQGDGKVHDVDKKGLTKSVPILKRTD